MGELLVHNLTFSYVKPYCPESDSETRRRLRGTLEVGVEDLRIKGEDI